MRWGFLGAGRIAMHVMAGAVQAADGAELYAVASRDPDRARLLGATRVFSSYDELLDDDKVDVVYVALPNDMHARWTCAALARGKHVLCEKPLALDVGQVDGIAAAARDAGRLVVEAAMWRWHPRTRALEKLLGGGARQVDVGFCFEGVADGDYRLNPERGGGALYDVGCYGIAAALLAFDWQQPTTVTASMAIGSTGIDMSADVTLGFDEGTARVHASMVETARQWLRIDDIEVTPPVFTAWWANETEIAQAGSRTSFLAVDPYRLMVEAVSARARGEDVWVVPLEQSRHVAAVMDQVRTTALGALSAP